MLVMFIQPPDLSLQHCRRDCLCPGAAEGSPPGEAMAEPALMAGECLYPLQPGPAVLCSTFYEQPCLTMQPVIWICSLSAHLPASSAPLLALQEGDAGVQQPSCWRQPSA